MDGKEPANCHSKERVVSQVRLRALLCATSGIHYGTESTFRGDSTKGDFIEHDGSGNFDYFL